VHTKSIEIASALVRQARKGNQQAIYKLYKMYVAAMYNISIRIVSNQLDAEDILQESFTIAFNSFGSLKEDSLFSAWLKRIVINKSISHLKRNKQEFTNVDKLQLAEDEFTDDELSNSITPEMIHNAIKTLPDKARVVLNLYLLEGYRHKEIAELLDISESTSKSQYRRACRILQDKLNKAAILNKDF
jgi:RNA polymerase sigma-70 factor (ECF subfamily)